MICNAAVEKKFQIRKGIIKWKKKKFKPKPPRCQILNNFNKSWDHELGKQPKIFFSGEYLDFLV